MKRWMVLALAAALSCEAPQDDRGIFDPPGGNTGGDGGGAAGVDSGGAGGGDAGAVIGPQPEFTDGEALAAWMLQVAEACPQASSLTVPGGWAMSMLAESGCVIYTPSWEAIPSDGIWQWVSDDTRLTGLMIIAGSVQGTGWDEASLADIVIDGLAKIHPDLDVIASASQDDPYGTGWRIRSLLLRFTNEGTPSVGALRLVHGGCSVVLGTCAVTADVMWTPVDAYSATACTLLQVEASFHCPSKGGNECDEGDCDAGCKAKGSAGGVCVGDNCMCQ